MLKMIDSLEQFVALDLPFQKVEREDRVAALTDLMNRADVTISEKYRKILEAYQIRGGLQPHHRVLQGEPGQGWQREDLRVPARRPHRVALPVSGWSGDRHVEQADPSVGRVAQEYRSAVEQGLRIAKKQAPPALIKLPVQTAEKAS